MHSSRLRATLLRFVSLSLICMGFAQVAPAGMIGTAYLLDAENRLETRSRVETLLARDDVARQFEALGVDEALIAQRLDAMSTAELAELEGMIDEKIAGGNALGVIGALFLVLLILEILGVTNVFTAV